MKCNVGKLDKTIRSLAGVAVIIIGVIYGSWFGLIGVVLLATAALSWCPAYVPFNFSTVCKNDSSGSGGCGCGR